MNHHEPDKRLRRRVINQQGGVFKGSATYSVELAGKVPSDHEQRHNQHGKNELSG